MAGRYVYRFGGGVADGSDQDRELLGGKGANLAQMVRLGMPVPPGFTITTEACRYFFRHDGRWPDGLEEEVDAGLSAVEAQVGKRFGSDDNPLLVSVRSGAAVSMPGMMDTVLNLGLNDVTVEALARRSGKPRFAWDSYRRFVTMFGDVVLGIHYSRFARVVDRVRQGRDERNLSVDELKEIVEELKGVIVDSQGHFPADPREQLHLAIDAVFRSANTARARYYRKTHGLPEDMGTAVNVQAMVFGNMGPGSATGVCFTRSPKDGRKVFFGEWLPNAQGEDVVAGTHTPLPLHPDQPGAQEVLEKTGARPLSEAMPEVYQQLCELKDKLEAHYKDMQDIEFTIEDGRLYLLQTRTGKRTPAAAVQIAVDLVEEGLIDIDTALSRIDPGKLEMVLRPVLDPDAPRKVIAKGLDASPGAATGRVVFHSDEAQELAERGEQVILVRMETSPEDIQGMTVAQGVLTSRGGQTSHAAVVARGMGKPCVVGCADITVDYARKLFYAGDTVVRHLDWITIDGASGEVMLGRVPTLAPPTDSGAMATLLTWADQRARLAVRANADNGPDAARARSLGAVGIGLCRTEHMFFQPEALRAMREMLLAEDERSRTRALAQVLPLQRAEFERIFRAMDGLPVTIRLLDPPLHEFLPHTPGDINEVAKELGVRTETLTERLRQLHEANPMMGHRGVRIGITTPEIYRTQVRAIFEAATALTREGVEVIPEVMIPLVAIPKELEILREQTVEVAEEVMREAGVHVDYRVGTMIEIPRAALLADQVAEHADFFSFGTNDLTQMTYGFSRDDMSMFLPAYLQKGVLADSPLAHFDVEGVGQLVTMGTERGRSRKPQLKVGVCGEHGGDPAGVRFFHKIRLDYVSCSPFRVPVARLAAAHAAIEEARQS
ncbi:MAG: pyruvate, phosphate dikinase [Deltaproteobacteria bacterium]|nr:MAG: pyruvate, phosphate dikinase [Deltaproteobacteria bacterium]